MERKELITKATELGIQFDRNINTIKSSEIEQAITSFEKTDEPKTRGRKTSTSGNTLRERIIVLGKQGLTKTQIHKQLVIEHATLNYRYVVQTLLKAQIAVPRQVRVFTAKAEPVA